MISELMRLLRTKRQEGQHSKHTQHRLGESLPAMRTAAMQLGQHPLISLAPFRTNLKPQKIGDH